MAMNQNTCTLGALNNSWLTDVYSSKYGNVIIGSETSPYNAILIYQSLSNYITLW